MILILAIFNDYDKFQVLNISKYLNYLPGLYALVGALKIVAPGALGQKPCNLRK